MDIILVVAISVLITAPFVVWGVIKPRLDPPGSPGRAIAIAVIYTVANIASVTLVELPGLGMYVLWGVIGPLTIAIAGWIWLRKRVKVTRHWLVISSVATGFFVALGSWSLYRITSFWAGV